ncbi:hypothetical protein F4819DRAFT_412417 [Hypoxylon fuscum]|nr:hypothetical protein F4819DRAFT_412417 [Hypoxylon fuscum]
MGSSASYPTNRPFAGKTDQIERQYEEFWRQATARADVEAYLKKTEGYEYPSNLPKWIKTSTPFTNWAGTSFAESKNALLVGNHSSFDIEQYPDAPEKAGMSMIHILGIPKAGIFNGVSLDSSNVFVVDEMIDLFKRSWTQSDFREAILNHQRARIEGQPRIGTEDPVGYSLAMQHYEELESRVHDLTVDDFAFGFHLWPDHSIGHLHLHIIAMPRAFRKFSTCAHDNKTKDALEVRDFIKSWSLI